MKFVFVLLTIVAMNAIAVPWEADFAQFSTQFESFQGTPANGIIINEEGSPVLHYAKLDGTKYAGVITKEWVASPSGEYWITIDYKGTLDKRTGAFLAYTRSDKEHIVHGMGMDYDKNFDLYQIFELKPIGEWRTYNAHVRLPNIGTVAAPKYPSIKIVIERGLFFNDPNYDGDAKFRNLKIKELIFQCPDATPADKQMQLGYLTFLFDNRNIKYRVLPQLPLSAQSPSKGQFKFEYPNIFDSIKCLKASFYGLNKDGNVIDKFDVKKTEVIDLMATSPELRTAFTFDFTMNEIETLGCPSQEVDYKDNKKWTKYTCNYEYHFWYNNQQTFNTKQASFDFTKNNSQAIFKSNFFVFVYKQETTELKTLIRTLLVDSPCTGICELDMSLKLALKIKVKGSSTYVDPSATPLTVTWTDYTSFKIESTPSDYNLELIKIFVTTETEVVELGEMFITSYIQNMNKSTKGQLTFDMLMSGESGLEKGKKFDLQFLTKATAASRFLQSSSGLPKAQISGKLTFISGEASGKTTEEVTKKVEEEVKKLTTFAGNLSFGLLMLLFMLFAL